MGKTLVVGLLGICLVGCAPSAMSKVTPPRQDPQVALADARRLKDEQNAGINPDKEFASYRAQNTIEGYQEYLYRHHQGDKYYEEGVASLDALLHPDGPDGQPVKVTTKQGGTTISSSTPEEYYRATHEGASPPPVSSNLSTLEIPARPKVAASPFPPSDPPPLDKKAREAMECTIKPLQSLAAATEAGLNYQLYGMRLVDAKVDLENSITQNSSDLPTVFKNETRGIFEVYQDAQLAWLWKIKQGTYCDQSNCSYDRSDTFVSSLLDKYPFLHATILKEAPGGLLLPGGIWANSQAIQLLWKEAKGKTQKLAAAIPPEPLVPETPGPTIEERLRELKMLLEKKLINVEEYSKKRAEILRGL